MLVLLLWHRGCLSDITGALFCCPGTKVDGFLFHLLLLGVASRPFCMFLSKMTFYNLVHTTIASFTPLLSWLKGAPPGINPSSRQQKKVPRGAGASGALVIRLEASGCERRANGSCLGRFILQHSVAAASSSLSSSAFRALRRAVNWWIVSSLQKYRVRMDGRAIWRLPGRSRSLRS